MGKLERNEENLKDGSRKPMFSLSLKKKPLKLFIAKTLSNLFNPIQDGLFWGCSRMGGGEAKIPPIPKICHTYPTMTKLGTVISYSN